MHEAFAKYPSFDSKGSVMHIIEPGCQSPLGKDSARRTSAFVCSRVACLHALSWIMVTERPFSRASFNAR